MKSRRNRVALAAVVLSLAATAGRSADPGRAADVRARASQLLAEGVTAYRHGDHREAVARLRESADIALNSFSVHYQLGLALIGDRRFAEAVEALDIALDLDPDHLDALIALGDAYLAMGDLAEARAAYHRALNARSAFADALDGLARSYESEAHGDQAVEHYLRAIASNKGFAPAYMHLGQLYLQQRRVEEAVALHEEAVSIRPDWAPGLNRLAMVYGMLGLRDEALAKIQRAIDLEPRNPAHRVTAGEIELGTGAINAAERSFAAALAVDPTVPEAHEGLAQVARRGGDYAKALSEVELGLADPRIPAGTALRLRKLREQLEVERAGADELEMRIGAGTATPEDHAALAALYARRGQWARAAELERLAPETAEHRERLAYLLFQAGEYREAQRLYAQLASEGSRTDLAINNGVSLALLGDEAGAVAAYRDVLARQPDARFARLYLANSLLRQGSTAEAARTYKEFLDANRTGEAAERVRRILKQIAPELVPQTASPLPTLPPPQPQPPQSPPGPTTGSSR